MALAATEGVFVMPPSEQTLLPIHPLRLRSDQVFSEVRATLSGTFLELVHQDRFTLFNRLQAETGVQFENKENNNTCVVCGDLDQILLAKLKLETYILDFQDALLHAETGTSGCDNDDFLSAKHNIDTSRPLALHQIKTEMVDDAGVSKPRALTVEICGLSKKAKLSPTAVTSNSHRSPILAGLIGLKSRRKVGRPRKLDSGVTSDTSPGLLRELPFHGKRDYLSNFPVDAHEYSPELDFSNSPKTCSGNESHENSYCSPGAINGGRTILEDEAERKANDWLALGLDPSQLMETSIEEEEITKDSQFEYQCELCNFKATREGQFLKHVLIHGKQDTVHKCEKCNFASVSLNHLNRHRLTHSDSVFKCPQCSYLTDEAKSLARHVTLKHTMVADSLPKGSGMLQCNDCSYQTTKIYHFERHLLVHNRDLKGLLQVYHCDLCPYKTHRKEHFLRHRDNVHLRNRPYQCGSCSRSYKKEDALRQHERTVHYRSTDGTMPSLMDLVLASTSDETGSPADRYAPSMADAMDCVMAPPTITQTTTSSGASISIIPSPISGTVNGRSSYSSLRPTFGSSGGIPSLIAGALKANRINDTGMSRTADSSAASSSSSRFGSALSLVSSVSITPAIPGTSSSVSERSATLDKASISISPLANFKSPSSGMSSP